MQVQGQNAATPQKPKIAVALQDEFGRVPTEEEIDHVFHLTRVMWKVFWACTIKSQGAEEKWAARDLLATTYPHWLRLHFNN
jgi:hypothetical protein